MTSQNLLHAHRCCCPPPAAVSATVAASYVACLSCIYLTVYKSNGIIGAPRIGGTRKAGAADLGIFAHDTVREAV